MTELTTNQIIKIILGVFAVVAVVGGLYLFFSGTVIDFIKNLMGDNNVTKFVLVLLR